MGNAAPARTVGTWVTILVACRLVRAPALADLAADLLDAVARRASWPTAGCRMCGTPLNAWPATSIYAKPDRSFGAYVGNRWEGRWGKWRRVLHERPPRGTRTDAVATCACGLGGIYPSHYCSRACLRAMAWDRRSLARARYLLKQVRMQCVPRSNGQAHRWARVRLERAARVPPTGPAP